MGKTSKIIALLGVVALVAAAIIIYCFTDASGTKATAQAKDAAVGANAFGIRLFKELAGEEGAENVVVSGPSIAIALALFNEGVPNDPSSELIAKALGFSDAEKSSLTKSYSDLCKRLHAEGEVTLSVSNGVAIPSGAELSPDFQSKARDEFRAEVLTYDRTSATAHNDINNWISKNTNGQITDLVNDDDLKASLISFINTIAFKGAWETSFNAANTMQFPFYPEVGDAFDATMMREDLHVGMHVTPTYGAVRLPYKGGQHSMVAILPRGKRTLVDLRSELTDAMWADVWTGVKEVRKQPESVVFPKFRLSWKAELSSILASDKIQALSPVSDVLVRHQAVVEVDEAGTTASAATVMHWRSAPPEGQPEPFKPYFNRPFLFAIVDHDSGAILFLGQVVDPRKE